MTSQYKPTPKYAWDNLETVAKNANGIYTTRLTEYSWEDTPNKIKIILQKPVDYEAFSDLRWDETFISLQIQTTTGKSITFIIQDLFESITSAKIDEKHDSLQIILVKADASPWDTLVKSHHKYSYETDSEATFSDYSDIDLRNNSFEEDINESEDNTSSENDNEY